MRKLHILTVTILAILVTSCSSTKKPDGTVTLYMKALKHQEFYEAAKLQLPDASSDLVSEAGVLRDNLSTNPIKKFSIVGVQKQSEDRAIVAVRIGWVSATMPDCISMLPVTKNGNEWFIGEPAKPEVNPQMDYNAYMNEEGAPEMNFDEDEEGAFNDDFDVSDGD